MIDSRIEQIIKNLREMRLPQMAEDILSMIETEKLLTMSVIDVLEQITQDELISRKNNTILRYKKKAKLSILNARIEEIDYSPERNLNKAVMEQLATNKWIEKHRNVIILGACGTGKTYISNALGNNACESQYTVLYTHLFELLDDIRVNTLDDGVSTRVIKRYAKPDVLIIDDFLISPILPNDVMELFKIMEFRYNKKSTIIVSQLEPKEWHKSLGANTIADSILDRITPNAYTLILSGKSLREKKEE